MTFDELLKQEDDSLKTFLQRENELKNVLLQSTEKIDKSFEKVVIELKEMFQKIPYCYNCIEEIFIKDGYKLKVLVYRDTQDDNFISVIKDNEHLIKIYKYDDVTSMNACVDKSLYGKAFILQNLEEIKATIMQALYSVVKSNNEYRKKVIERLEKEVSFLGSAIIQNEEEEQWSDYISYVLHWCSENLQKTDSNILSFDEWKVI